MATSVEVLRVSSIRRLAELIAPSERSV